MIDAGLNPLAAELLAESLLRHPDPKTVTFPFPINRKEMPAWAGVKFTLEPIPAAEQPKSDDHGQTPTQDQKETAKPSDRGPREATQ